MDIGIIAQIAGWIASVLAIFSYSMQDVRKIRLVNCVAAAFFIAYGFLLGAPAIVIGNATLACVHLTYLFSHDRFGEVIAKHFRTSILVFTVYAATSIIWVSMSTNMNIAEILGIVSSVAFVGGFLLPREVPMRVTCSIALVMNVLYAFLIASPQVALTNSVSLAVNVFRLVQRCRGTQPAQGSDLEPVNERA